MTYPRSEQPTRVSRRWDRLGRLWVAAAFAPVSGGAAAAYRTVFLTARRLVVGRRLAVRMDAGELTLTVTEFDSRLDTRALSAGQLGSVRLAARDIVWAENRFDAATVVLHNVALRPSASPVIVAAPVHLTLDVPLDELFRWAAPRLAGSVDADGVALLRLAGRPAFGGMEVDARLDGSVLSLRPRGVHLRRTRWRLPARTPAYRVRLPELPHGLQLTGIALAPGVVRLTGTMPHWRTSMPRGRLEHLLGQLATVGRPLNLTRLVFLR